MFFCFCAALVVASSEPSAWRSIWVAHSAGGKSQFGLDPGTSLGRRVHIALGYLAVVVCLARASPPTPRALACMETVVFASDLSRHPWRQGTIAQCLIGGVKRWATPRPVHKWHGKAGPYIWGVGLLNILCGVWIWGGWSSGCAPPCPTEPFPD